MIYLHFLFYNFVDCGEPETPLKPSSKFPSDFSNLFTVTITIAIISKIITIANRLNQAPVFPKNNNSLIR